MRNFNDIITTLKTITNCTTDKAIAIELNIKPTTFSSMKRRGKPPLKSIIAYCGKHNINANIILLDKPIEEGKVRVKYFRSFDGYVSYLGIESHQS